MTVLEGVVRFPFTNEGVQQARKELEVLEQRLLSPGERPVARVAIPGAASPRSRGKVLFDHLDAESRGRDVLRVLPEGKDNAVTPAELARLMRPGSNGKPLKNGSVRAVIRNLWRGAEHLKSRGELDSRVVQRHFDDYERDRAARYYLECGDGEGIAGRWESA